MPSRRFELLRRRVGELREHLLPEKFDPTGTYDDGVHERARAFRVLVHAEFEAFIEDRVEEIAQDRFLVWQSNRVTSRCIVSMVAYHVVAQSVNDPTSIINPPQKASPLVHDRVEQAKNSLINYAKRINNGIKEDNLLRLLMPLGLEGHEFDTTWLASITSWATVRGDHAHQSTVKIQGKLDPRSEYFAALDLLNGFEKIDEALNSV